MIVHYMTSGSFLNINNHSIMHSNQKIKWIKMFVDMFSHVFVVTSVNGQLNWMGLELIT